MPTTLSEKALQVKESSTLAITAKAKEMKAAGTDVVSFGAGEPDFNTPENIAQAAIKAILDGKTKYTTASGTNELKKAISDKFKKENDLPYEPNQIVISNGAKHSLTNTFEAILNPGDEVIIPAPYWLSYPEIVKLAGGVPVFVRCDRSVDYKLSAAALEAAITPKTKALILNTPNNPTGMVYSREELEAIAKVAVEKDIFVVSDEIYEKLIYTDAPHISIGSLNKEIFARTITVNGMAKSYAMTGWRIGYIGAPVQLAKVMGNVQSHQTSNACSISQEASTEALTGNQDAMALMKAEFARRRDYISERVNAIPGISAVTPQGAFYIFVDLRGILGKTYKGQEIRSAQDFGTLLLSEEAVAVIPCADFGFEDHMRLSYAISMEDIQKGLDRIESLVKNILQ